MPGEINAASAFFAQNGFALLTLQAENATMTRPVWEIHIPKEVLHDCCIVKGDFRLTKDSA